MYKNSIKQLFFTVIIIISVVMSCTDMGQLGEDAVKAFNEEDVKDAMENLSEASIILASGDTVNAVTDGFSLPVTGDNGTAITWQSSNTDIISISENGTAVVTRPSGNDAVVTLTATITKGSVSHTKTITVTVSGISSGLTDSLSAADIIGLNTDLNNVTTDLNLPAAGDDGHTITWSSSNTSVITDSGVVIRPAAGSANVTLTMTAVISDGTETITKEFSVTVLALDTVTHTVTFHANGGSGIMAPQTIAENTSANLNVNTFTYSDHSFAGWATTSGGTVSYADGAGYSMGNSDADLYAVWNESHGISVDTDIEVEGDITIKADDSVEIAKGNSADFSLTSTLSYSSCQWYMDGDAISGATSSTVTIATGSMSTGVHTLAVMATDNGGSEYSATLTIYVTNYLTITFDRNGGSGAVLTQSVAEGVSVSLTANTYTCAGKSFAGWSTTSTGTVEYADKAAYTIGSSDVTLYAVWAPRTIAIKSITPDGEDAVSADSNIVIVFSESLDGITKGTLSFASPAVSFKDGDNASITFSSTNRANDTITVNPAGNLQKTNYTSITVTGFKDAESVSVVSSDPDYYFPVRGAMDLYFPFTNGSLTDASGRGVTLKTVSSPVLKTGYKTTDTNGAYEFDGVDDYFQVVGDLGIDCDADFTICCWVYINAITNFKGILSNYHAPGANGTMLRINSSWNGHYNALDLCEGFSNNNVISTGKWIHIVAIYRETSTTNKGTVQFYVDGEDAGSASTGYNVVNTSYGFTMGTDYLVGTENRKFSGIIDEVRFYKYALTETEAKNLYAYDDIDGE